MPLVQRAETDMFRFYKDKLVDVMVNPVNTLGTMDAGISEEFKQTFPAMFEEYHELCQDKKSLNVGQMQHVYDTQSGIDILNIATRRHYADQTELKDLRKCLFHVETWLKKPENKFKRVVIPMLGIGYGKEGYGVSLPSFQEVLGDLPNLINLSMAPDKMDHIPKYLGVVGPRSFANTHMKDGSINPDYEKQKTYVRLAITQACNIWGIQPEMFDAWVSGGAVGVDSCTCGDGTEESYEKSLNKEMGGGKPPIVILPDWDRFPKAAGFIRNRNIVDVATHLIAIKPKGVIGIGTSHTIRLALENNKALEKSGGDKKSLYYKHVIVKGDQTLHFKGKETVSLRRQTV